MALPGLWEVAKYKDNYMFTQLKQLFQRWRYLKATVKRNLDNLKTVLLSLFSLLALTWVAEGLNGSAVLPDLFSIWWAPYYERPGLVGPRATGAGFWLWFWPMLALSLLLIYTSMIALSRLRQPMVREMAPPQPAKPRKVMVAMLSLLREHECLDNGPDAAQTFDELLARIDSNSNWNGEPLLRAIQAHRYQLERLYLLVSDSEEMQRVFKVLYTVLGRVLPELEVRAYQVKSATDLHRLYQALNHIERELQIEGYKEADIVLDATGGTKPYSMAAALATLHNDLSLQYIESGPRGLQINEYCVALEERSFNNVS